MVVLMADEDALACPSHAMLGVVLLETLQPSQYRGIFFRLGFLGPKRVVAEWVQPDRLGLVFEEGEGDDGRGGFDLVEGDGRHGGLAGRYQVLGSRSSRSQQSEWCVSRQKGPLSSCGLFQWHAITIMSLKFGACWVDREKLSSKQSVRKGDARSLAVASR